MRRGGIGEPIGPASGSSGCPTDAVDPMGNRTEYTNTPLGPQQYNAAGYTTNMAGAVCFNDYAGRLVGYQPPASPPRAAYDYDARGRRVMRVLNPGMPGAQATQFAYAGMALISELPGAEAPRDDARSRRGTTQRQAGRSPREAASSSAVAPFFGKWLVRQGLWVFHSSACRPDFPLPFRHP